MKTNCPKEIVPSVDNEAAECCDIVNSNCVLLSEVDTFLKLMKGDSLTTAIHEISERLSLHNTKLFKLREYYANMSQTGTTPPLLTVLDNTFTQNLIASYVGVGEYNLTSTQPIFDLVKTFIHMPSNAPTTYTVDISVISPTVINIQTKNSVGVLTDGLLNKTPLTIKSPY